MAGTAIETPVAARELTRSDFEYELPPELVDIICFKPGIWPNCRSRGAVTAEAMTTGLAPG